MGTFPRVWLCKNAKCPEFCICTVSFILLNYCGGHKDILAGVWEEIISSGEKMKGREIVRVSGLHPLHMEGHSAGGVCPHFCKNPVLSLGCSLTRSKPRNTRTRWWVPQWEKPLSSSGAPASRHFLFTASINTYWMSTGECARETKMKRTKSLPSGRETHKLECNVRSITTDFYLRYYELPEKEASLSGETGYGSLPVFFFKKKNCFQIIRCIVLSNNKYYFV